MGRKSAPPPPPASLWDDAADVLDEAWPSIFIIVAIAMLFWVSSQFFSGQSKAIYMSVFFSGASAWAVHALSADGGLQPVWRTYTELSDMSKYMVTVLLVTFAYFASRFAAMFDGEGSAGASMGADCIASKKGVAVKYPATLSGDPKKAFVQICDMLIAENVEELTLKYEAIPEQVEWVKKMLEYNVKGGKMNRGMGVLDVLAAFAEKEGREMTKADTCKGAVLGWSIEWLQAFFLVADDVMDESITRRGQPCWYKQEHVKLVAINDSFILESLVFMNLKRHFQGESFYGPMMDLFHEVTYQTEMGQLLDLTSQPMHEAPDLTRFTETRYNMIVKYKTAFYTFYLPCAIGMIYAGVTKVKSFDLAREICCSIGTLFQIQDDVLDCYGDPEKIGKVGTDIQDNKCSWLVVQALKTANPAQKQMLIASYGKDDPTAIGKVKDLYKDLGLQAKFKAHEEAQNASINALIQQVQDVPPKVFSMFLDKIYKREK